MATNKRDLKAYVRYDGTGRVISGSLILQRFKPKVGNWQETPAYLCCNPGPLPSNCVQFVVDTTDGTEFTFNFTTTGPINFTINWGDGTTHPDSGGGGFYQEIHTYPELGQQYTARICFDNPESVLELNFVGND
jgi:hypothetical protein